MKITGGLKESQVLQRLGSKGATVDIGGECSVTGTVKATLQLKKKAVKGFREISCGKSKDGRFQAKLKNIPAGGPYTLVLSCGKEKTKIQTFFSGDVWVLAGQSNMEGVGNMSDPAPSHPWIRSFSMRRTWRAAEDPLHILAESPDACHNNGTQCSEEKGEFARKGAKKGVGCGLFFANEMLRLTGIPQGLISTAHGGTSMQQWDPNLDPSPAASLYSSMLQSVKETGQPVAGVLWYQGESDANPKVTGLYTDRMKTLVQSTRRDFKNPKLPWIVVQISRVYGKRNESDNKAWNSIQEQQRLLPNLIKHLEVVSAIDLPLDDAIHIGALGFPRLALRMVQALQSIVQPSSKNIPPPRLESIRQQNSGGTGWRFVVSYKNVQGRLRSKGEPSGFAALDAAGVELPIVFKTVLEGSKAIVDLCPATGLLPDYCQLSYGHGSVPYCNITDDRDAALPVFGPLPLSPRTAATSYLTRWELSKVLNLPVQGNAIPKAPENIPTTSKAYPIDGFINEHDRWIGKTGFCYFFTTLDLPESMQLDFKMGYDGPFALWLDGQSFFQDLQGANPCLPDKASKIVRLEGGRHKICIGMDLAHGKSWGFFLRLIRKDVSPASIKDNSFILPEFPK